MRESAVEKELHQLVTLNGGTTYKFVSPGRTGVPDRIVLWPMVAGVYPPRVHFIETKAPGKKPRVRQLREQNTLRYYDGRVYTIDTYAKVIDYVERNV